MEAGLQGGFEPKGTCSKLDLLSFLLKTTYEDPVWKLFGKRFHTTVFIENCGSKKITDLVGVFYLFIYFL